MQQETLSADAVILAACLSLKIHQIVSDMDDVNNENSLGGVRIKDFSSVAIALIWSRLPYKEQVVINGFIIEFGNLMTYQLGQLGGDDVMVQQLRKSINSLGRL